MNNTLSPLQQEYFDLLKKADVMNSLNESEESIKRDIRKMNAIELRQAIAASKE